ncbi:hypothetical protein LWI29_032063 [Acer saccharum]|uniref:Uncharacterized protein n=1 Tax=Acer saccharum TaxID=4024 RepID=A0AA39TYY5_ACESA|nr:hypothetical protein LWI29_032063 [Acer saccharum]
MSFSLYWLLPFLLHTERINGSDSEDEAIDQIDLAKKRTSTPVVRATLLSPPSLQGFGESKSAHRNASGMQNGSTNGKCRALLRSDSISASSVLGQVCSDKILLGQHSTRLEVYSAKCARPSVLRQDSTRPTFHSARSLLGQVCSDKILLGQHSTRLEVYSAKCARPSVLRQDSTRPTFHSARSLLGQVCSAKCARTRVYSAKIPLGQDSTRPTFHSARSLLGQVCSAKCARTRFYSAKSARPKIST